MAGGTEAGGEFGACDYWRVWNSGPPLGQALAGRHEYAHRTLAATTSWGVATSVFALLAESRPGSGFPGLVRAMIAASRNCHEAYATYVSLVGSDQAAALQAYPQYRRRAAEAEDLIRYLPPAGARLWVFEAAVTACMNVPVLPRILDRGLGQFCLADVRSAEYPDQRMRALAALGPGEWDGIWGRLHDEFADTDGWQALSQPLTGTGWERVASAPEELLAAFHQRAYSYIAAALARHGIASVPWADFAQPVPDLLRAFAAYSGSQREVARLIDLLRPMEHSASFAGQGLVLRREPGPARLVPAGDLDDAGWQSLLQGTRPNAYLYVLARRTWDLAAGYRLADDERRLLPADPNTTVTLLRAAPGEGEHGPRLVVLSSVAELARAVEALEPDWVLSNPSVMTFHDSGWLSEWLTPLAQLGPLGIRIDQDPLVLLDAWCKPGNRVRYSFFDLRADTGQLTRVFVCQWSSLPAEHAFAAVCSPDVAMSLGSYLAEEHAAYSERDDDLLGEVTSWLRVIVSAMTDDQHEFRFHATIPKSLVTGGGAHDGR